MNESPLGKATFTQVTCCPVCEGPLDRLDGGLSTFVRAFDAVVVSEFGVCPACDFGCMLNPLDGAGMEAYYAANDQYRREMMTVEESSHLESQLTFISRHVSQPVRTVLEIGPDNGAFLVRCVNHFGAEGFFSELNLAAASRLAARGYQNVHASDRRMALVVMRHVLEHIVHPAAFLRELHGRLEPGGVLFIEVPDCSNLALGEADTFQLEHVNYFSLHSLTRVASLAGFRVQAAETARTPGYSTTPNRVLRVVLKPMAEPEGVTQSRGAWEGLMAKTLASYAALDEFVGTHAERRIALYGGGTRTLEFSANSRVGFQPVAIYDRDPKKIGTELLGVTVSSPDDLDPSDFDVIVLMVVGYACEVRQFLLEKGVSSEQLLVVGEDLG